MIDIRMTVPTQKLTKLFSRLPNTVRTNVGNTVFDHGRYLSRILKREAMRDPTASSSRAQAVKGIIAKKVNISNTKVSIPGNLAMLDSMRPHFVSLSFSKPRLRAWANKHYDGNTVKSGLSRVYRTPTNRIMYRKGRKSFLYVMPHKFIRRSITQANRRLPEQLRRSIVRSFEEAR